MNLPGILRRLGARTVGDHIREYTVAEPGCPEIRVVRSPQGWVLKRGHVFTKDLAIVDDLGGAIRRARTLSLHLDEERKAEAARAARARRNSSGGAQ